MRLLKLRRAILTPCRATSKFSARYFQIFYCRIRLCPPKNVFLCRIPIFRARMSPMNLLSKNARLLFWLIIGFILFNSCSNQGQNAGNRAVAKGGCVYGGKLRYNEGSALQSLYPTLLNDNTTQRIATQIYESLLRLDPRTLKPLPGIAEKWEVDNTGMLYTFHLRKDVKFHDDSCFEDGKGRGLTAADILYSFKLLCTKSENNQTYNSIFKGLFAGADAFYEAENASKDKNPECIRAIDDYTVQIRLAQPSVTFLELVANPSLFCIVPKEAIEKYGIKTSVGTGPFTFATLSADTSYCVLVRNPNYYRKDSHGNQLPFLDSLYITFNNNKNAELDLFQKGEIDFSWGLTADAVRNFVPQAIEKFRQQPPAYTLDHSPEMATQFYEFNLSRPPFNNLKIRQAFSYAINRNRIIEDVLGGEAYGPGINGICPPGLPGYTISDVKGYDYNPELARKLLAEAGYPDGKGFPPFRLVVNSGRSRNTTVASEIQNQLREVLNVNMEINSVSFQQKQLDSKYGRGELFRDGWTADYPSPQSFLTLFYGRIVPDSLSAPSYPNVSRYRNAEFDNLLDSARAAKTLAEANALFLKAEQIMIADAPALVLWYDESYRLAYGYIKNFMANPMHYYDFSEVYLKPDESKKTETSKDSSVSQR